MYDALKSSHYDNVVLKSSYYVYDVLKSTYYVYVILKSYYYFYDVLKSSHYVNVLTFIYNAYDMYVVLLPSNYVYIGITNAFF